ncbi:MAG: type IX secretion system membrane protein PorP/SprF [Paludibacteraceae bacterium]|nr:type IX secretion system membrane protein PorP/SprF [Paludibacteraceae bacterium]
MKIKHILVALLTALLFNTELQAQEEIVFDQYYYNYYLVDPAVAGAERCTHFMLTGKFQWMGMQDAPMTQTLSFRTRLRNGLDKLGIGAYVYNDKNGWSKRQGGQVSLAYHIPLSGGSTRGYMMKQNATTRQLSFGVSGVVSHFTFDEDLYMDEMAQLDNAVANGGRDKGYYFNANVGTYFLWDNYFAGLSVANLIPTEMVELGQEEPKRPLSFFFFTGYDFQLGNKMVFEPGMMFKADVNKDRQLDLHLKFMQDIPDNNLGYWLQLLYRHTLDAQNDVNPEVGGAHPLSLSAMGGVSIKKVNIGYAYTLALTGIVRHNSGTHEVMLGYSFCKTQHFCR